MQPIIERALAPLVGLRLWGPERESNRLSLQLGEASAARARVAPAHPAGEYALHVFCAWRLARGAELLAGSADLFTPADPDEDLETFDYEAPGATWWDVRLAAYFDAAPADGPRVAAVTADALGGARLTLADGAVLELFANSAPAEHFETEFWRLTRAGHADPDFVVGTAGAEHVAIE